MFSSKSIIRIGVGQ